MAKEPAQVAVASTLAALGLGVSYVRRLDLEGNSLARPSADSSR